MTEDEFNYHHPAEDIDDEVDRSVVLEVQKRFRFVMDRAVAYILDAEDSEAAAWSVAFALESPHCMGLTMTQKAAELGLGKAAISKGANAFCRIADIPPSKYMLSDSAKESYRELRHAQEEERNKNNGTN